MTNPPAARQERRLNLTTLEVERLAKLNELPDHAKSYDEDEREGVLLKKAAPNSGEDHEAFTNALYEVADLRRTSEKLERENAKLRLLLALAYSGADLYGDDGELQDSRTHPFIDFKRDTADELDRKMKERGLKALRAAIVRKP